MKMNPKRKEMNNMYFRNEYWFLSNMYPCSIEIDGYKFMCVESAFQAMKNPMRAKEFEKLNGFEAKKLGRKVNLRPNWNNIRASVMLEIVACKFEQHPELMCKLIDIKEDIVEENTWNDTYWGVCKGVGKNTLGKILTLLREEYIHTCVCDIEDPVVQDDMYEDLPFH